MLHLHVNFFQIKYIQTKNRKLKLPVFIRYLYINQTPLKSTVSNNIEGVIHDEFL